MLGMDSRQVKHILSNIIKTQYYIVHHNAMCVERVSYGVFLGEKWLCY